MTTSTAMWQRVKSIRMSSSVGGGGVCRSASLASRCNSSMCRRSRKSSGASIVEILRSGLAMKANQELTWSQMLMAANAPMLAKRAMVDGDPKRGYLPSGQVAGLIDDWPPVAELADRIRAEAVSRLDALAAVRPQ